jgi:hypothetical protein
LTLGAAAISCAAFFLSAAPAAATAYKYCRRDITSYILQCGFDTLAQCQEMSFGRGADCFRNPSLGSAADAYVYAPGVRKTYAYAALPEMTREHSVAIETKISGSPGDARQL